MVKIEQRGGRLTEEEILHEEIMLFFLLILYVQKEKYPSEKIISLFIVIF